MFFFRTFLATIAAAIIAIPAFAADDNPAAVQPGTGTMQTQEAVTNKVNINKATAKDLMKVKGINASRARAIIAYRKKNGDFKSIDDLAKVKGFKKLKEDKIKEIEDQVSTE